jgi:hypothetical protein
MLNDPSLQILCETFIAVHSVKKWPTCNTKSVTGFTKLLRSDLTRVSRNSSVILNPTSLRSEYLHVIYALPQINPLTPELNPSA